MQPAYAQLTEALPVKPRQLRRTLSDLKLYLRSLGLLAECAAAEGHSGSADWSSHVIRVKGTPDFKPVIGPEKIMPDDTAMKKWMYDLWLRVVTPYFAMMELQLLGRAANNHLVGKAKYHVVMCLQPASQPESRLAEMVLQTAAEEFFGRVHPVFARVASSRYYIEKSFTVTREGGLDMLVGHFTNAISQARNSLNLAIERTYDWIAQPMPAPSPFYQSRHFA